MLSGKNAGARGLRAKTTCLIFCLTVVFFAVAVEAQQRILWQGAVNREQINVYANPSTRERVTAGLKSGDVVNVILEIAVMGDAWCRIATPGQPEPLGYVLCFNLEKGNFPSRQIAQGEPTATQSAAKSTTQPKATIATALTNKDILDMHKIGLPPEVLVAKIKSSQSNFDTSPSQLQKLKVAGLPDAVILAMVQASGATATSAVAQADSSKSETIAKVGGSQPQATLDCIGVSEGECERRIAQLSQTNCSGISRAECRNRVSQIVQTTFRQKDPKLQVSVAGNDNEIIFFDSAGLFEESHSYAADADAKGMFCSMDFVKVVFRPLPVRYGDEVHLNCPGANEAKSSPDSPSGVTNSPRPAPSPEAKVSVPKQQPSPESPYAKPVGGLSKNASKVCAKHPDWTAKACEIIAQHKITVGMTSEQVRQALQTGFSGWLNAVATGRRRTSLTHTAEGNVEVWDYSVPASFYEGRQISRGSTFYVYFTNGICTGWTQGN